MVMNDLNELNDLKILVDDPVLNIPVQYCALTRDAVIRDKSLLKDTHNKICYFIRNKYLEKTVLSSKRLQILYFD